LGKIQKIIPKFVKNTNYTLINFIIMIIDTIDNLDKYKALNPLLSKAIEYLDSHDLLHQEIGKTSLQGTDLVVNLQQTKSKTKEMAKLETHKDFIDIQIPLSDMEVLGYTPLCNLPDAEYDKEKDITFYPGEAENYFTLKPGQFAIFFPQDGHAPGISNTGLKKIVVKVHI